MSYKKSTALLCILSLTSTAFVQTNTHENVIIESRLLAMIDGTSLIDIGSIMNFARKARVIHHGKLDKETHESNGVINFFDGTKTVVELAELERTTTDPRILAELENAKKHALKKFSEISDPYMEAVKGTKAYMIELIETWSHIRDRKDSELLDWSKLDESQEMNAFHTNMKTFAQIDIFLRDLTCFLGDLVRSCKKSWADYKELVRQKAHEQHN